MVIKEKEFIIMHLITDDFNLKDILHMIDDDVTVLVSGESYTAQEFAVKVVENVQREMQEKEPPF